nr:DUF6603 domain-containing protein [Hahella ganghwensis]
MTIIEKTVPARAEESVPGSSGITFSGLDPILGSLGVLGNLLVSEGQDTYTLNNDWFTDPITSMKEGFSRNPEQFQALLSQILGDVEGNALGAPVRDPTILGTWYPIKNGDVETGLYLVSYNKAGDTVLGFGALHEWKVPQAPSEPLLQVSAFVLVPFVKVGNGNFDLTFDSVGYPILMGAAVDGDATTPLVDINGVQFNGVKASVSIDFAASNPFGVSLEVLALQLPGDAQPSNRSIADLGAISGVQLTNTASALFVGALTKTFPEQEDRIRFFAPLFGLSSMVPGSSVSLPILAWYDLFANSSNPAEPFQSWFTTIGSDPQLLSTWLSCLGGFIGDKSVSVTGTGDRNTPFAVAILSFESIGTLQVTTASVVEKNHGRFFYPGLAFAGKSIALGTSDAVFIPSANLELGAFALSQQGVSASPELNFLFKFALQNKTNGDPLATFKESGDNYSVGSLEGGLTLDLSGKPVPHFYLNNVDIPSSSFQALDLLSPTQLADAGAALLSDGLKTLLGVSTDNPNALSNNIAAVLGLIAPGSAGDNWPAELVPPFSANGMENSILNPIKALADYYLSILEYSGKVADQSAFYYMVESFALLLEKDTGSTSITVTGDGTPQSPWLAGISISNAALPAYVQFFQEPIDGGGSRLNLGLSMIPEIVVSDVTVKPSLNLAVASIDFPSSGNLSATWLPVASAALSLPNPIQTPEVGGLSVSIGPSQLSAAWSRFSGWSWSMFVDEPALVVNGDRITLGQSLNFDDQSSLQDLVTTGQATFAPFLVAALGTFLMRTETRPGLFFTGAMGLVPDITNSPIFPQGLAWSGFDQLTITSFSNPFPDLRKQVASDYATQAKAQSMLSLLAWTIDTSLTKAPNIGGTGTYNDPYPMPIPFGFDIYSWFTKKDQVLGLGVGREDNFQYQTTVSGTDVKFQFDLQSRLSLIEYSLAKGALDNLNNLPAFNFLGTLSNPDGNPLVDLPDNLGSVEKVILGCNLSVSTAGEITFEPVVTLSGATLPGQAKQDISLETYQSDSFTSALQSSFQTLLNAAVQTAVVQVKDVAGFTTAYDLLSILGLTLTRKADSDPYGINSAGWQGLLSDPDSYIRNQLVSLLENQESRTEFFNFLQQVFHITIPSFPSSLLELMTALEICGPADQGYPLQPLAVLQILSDPVNGLQTRFESLFSNAQTLATLTGELTRNIPETKYGRVSFSSNTNSVISVQVLPADAFELGSFLQVSGGIQLDLANRKLTGDISAYNPTLQLSLVDSLTLDLATGAVEVSVGSEIVWGNGSKPAAQPLTLLPFNSDSFLNQMADLAPVYSLNILLNAGIEDRLLKPYPLIQKLFVGFGLAVTAEGQNGYQMAAILGILRDPLGWLLSEAVLGTNGRFDVSKFVELLGNLPQVASSSGITLTPTPGQGLDITGLPYNFGINLTGADGMASLGFTTKDISIANKLGKVDMLKLSIGIGPTYQPAFSGQMEISAPELPAPFFTTVGYDRGFLLKLSQGTASAPTGLGVQLFPFLGWGTVAGEAASLAAATVIQQITPKLLDALENSGAQAFVSRMRTFATSVDLESLVNEILATLTPENFSKYSADQLLQMLLLQAFDWLKERFSTTTAPQTADAVKTLLSDVLPTQITTEGGRVVFNPGEDIPIQIKAGLNTDGYLGLWSDLNVPELKIVQVDVAETGVGVKIDSGDIQVSFGVRTLIPVESLNGPALSLNYIQGSGFVLAFDPLADPSNPSQASSLSRELLPVLFPGEGSLSKRLEAWLLDVIKDVLPRYISLLVLNQSSVHQWLETPIINDDKAPTPVLIFEATSLIIVAPDTNPKVYLLNSFDALTAITPKSFFGNFIKTLMENSLTLLTFGANKQGKITIGPQTGTQDHYGIQVAAPDLTLASIPSLVIQLGASDTAWISGSGGPSGDPGIGFYVPVTDSGGNIEVDFTSLNMALYNVGFDYIGTNGKPLVNLSRFTMDEVQPRALFSLSFDKGSPTLDFGAGITLKDIAISLSPNSLASGAGGNAIASNLLGSGGNSTEQNPPTNPTFSASAGYVSNIYVNLKSNTGNGEEVILPIQRSFGPLYVENLGLGWEQATKYLDFLFSGSVELAGLTASLIGLTVGVPTKTPTEFDKYSIDLQGLNITYQGGSVSVNAGLLKSDNPIEYTGVAIVSAGDFTLGALGSYAEIPTPHDGDVPSLFVFGALDIPLGGIPEFFVTGVAAGFSYNRSLKIPSIDEVQTFPLVEGVVKGSFSSGEDPKSALVKLGNSVEPEIGQYWLAAGLKFTTYKLLNSTALLFISFGREFEINLLGLSYASLPPEVKQNMALAYFELALKVSFRPSDGVVSAEAQLTPNSFVLSTDCKVTGGFAFYLWYKTIPAADGGTIPAGQFVITLGGYHPAFQKPSYYPTVPRLGMVWKMDISVGKISIDGGAYFALCPTAVMAGGYLDVTFELGPLKAWLNAYANFLIEWQPFYFNVGIGVTVGASFGTTIAGVSITIKAELGAQLQLEGPPTHGKVEVDWYVISFSIPVGSGSNATEDNNLDWSAFEQSFLPAPVQSGSGGSSQAQLLAESDASVQQVVKWNALSGLLNQNTGSDIWLVQPVPFAVSSASAIPCRAVTVTADEGGDKKVVHQQDSSAPLGVRPMGYNDHLDSPMNVEVIDQGGGRVDLVARGLTLTLGKNGAPSALWSQDPLNRQQAPAADDLLIPGAFFGLSLAADAYLYTGDVPAFPIENLKYTLGDTKDLPFSSVPDYPAAQTYSQLNAYTQLMTSIMSSDVIPVRNAIYATLEAYNILAPANPDLSVTASSADLVLQAPPVIARIGVYQNGGVVEPGSAPVLTAASKVAAAPKQTQVKAPELLGLFRRYRSTAPAAQTLTPLPTYRGQAKGRWTVTSGVVKRSAAATSLSSIPEPEFRTLYNGGIAVWKVDTQVGTTIDVSGKLPVVVATFNRSGALLFLTTLAADYGTYTLPEGTASVAVQVFGGEAGNTIGWQRDTVLSKVSSCWTAADACLIRVQNSQRIDAIGGAEIGVLAADKLLQRNRITGANQRQYDGWIQTLFPAGSSMIGVLLSGKDVSEDAISMTLARGRIPTKQDQAIVSNREQYNDSTLLLYQVPDGTDTDYIGSLLTMEDDSTSVLGIYGLSNVGAMAKTTLWKRLSLDYQALDLDQPEQASVQVKVQTKG